MRLGFDVTSLLVPQSGIGTYTKNLLDHLTQAAGGQSGTGELDIIPLANRPVAEAPGSPPRLNKTLWMQAVLPWQAGLQRLDVCHFTNNVAPLWTPCPSVVTIHDMTLWLYAQHHYAKRLLVMRPIIPLAARRAAAIITSRRGSLVEVAGNAAQFVDPMEVESIAEGLHRVLNDAAWREELRAKGLAQAGRFSWKRAATETLGVYRLVTDSLPIAGAVLPQSTPREPVHRP